jgi:hypothetical protein
MSFLAMSFLAMSFLAMSFGLVVPKLFIEHLIEK